MTKEEFLDKFGHFIDAPNGFQKLRELIFQLAVQGKLVPQVPDEEPASVLLERIAVEKGSLLSNGTIKKSKPLPVLTRDENAFQPPRTWMWVRFGEIGEIGSSSRVHKKDWATDGIPFYRAREIVKLSKYGRVDNELFITELLFRSLSQNGMIPEANDLMITGVGTIGTPYVVKQTDKFYFKDASVLIFKNHHGLIPGFLFILLKSPYWINEIHANSMGTTVHTLTISRAKSVPIPLPPLAEQHRIVTKVDELMALCDELEAEHNARNESHTRLIRAVHYPLTEAPDAASTLPAWERVRDHFGDLYTTKKSVQALRQTILQLAVQGKLVPQDANDEPARLFLKNLEKDAVNVNSLLENGSPLPHALPSGWVWVTIRDLGSIKGGGTPSKRNPDFWGGDIPWVSPKDMKVDFIEDSMDHISESAISESVAKLIKPDALLMVVRGMILAHSFPVAVTTKPVAINQDMKALELSKRDLSTFMLVAMKGSRDRMLKQVERSSHGTCRLDSNKLLDMILGLPPQNEQARIVTKVDELMALCDQLEAKIASRDETASRYAEAAVQTLPAA